MAVKRVDCFFLEVEDKPGVLAQFARRLEDARINLKGLWGYTNSAGKGKIACVPHDAKKFVQRTKNLGIATSRRVAFHISGPDRVGALCNVLDVLEKAQININVLDAIGFSGRFGAYIWVDPKDVKAAQKALKA
jgi:predicted amino acid-binding ACT domain protein